MYLHIKTFLSLKNTLADLNRSCCTHLWFASNRWLLEFMAINQTLGQNYLLGTGHYYLNNSSTAKHRGWFNQTNSNTLLLIAVSFMYLLVSDINNNNNYDSDKNQWCWEELVFLELFSAQQEVQLLRWMNDLVLVFKLGIREAFPFEGFNFPSFSNDGSIEFYVEVIDNFLIYTSFFLNQLTYMYSYKEKLTLH